MKRTLKSLVCAAFALALSTTSAFATITVNQANCTLPDGQVGEWYDVYFYFGADDPNNAFDGVSDDWDIDLKDGAVVPEGLGDFYVFKEDANSANLYSVAPVAAGTYEVWVTVTDGDESQDLMLTVTITDTPHLSVVDGGLLKSAYQGDAYSVALADTITGGSGNYSFVLTNGSLPPTGLTLTDGVISGTLNAVASYEGYAFDVTVTDLDDSSLDPIVVTYYIISKALSSQYYVDTNGTWQYVNCIELDADRTNLSATGLSSGWYVVPMGSSLSMNNAIEVSGEVHLILSDSSSMTITSGKAGIGNVAINVAQGEGNALNIYGQSGRSGKLTVTGGRRAVGISGTVRIYGGTVDARSGGSGIAGIDGTLVIGANMMANAKDSVITQIDPATALSRNETTGEVALDGSRYYYVSYAVATTISNIIYMDGETRLTDLEPKTYVEGTAVNSLPTPSKPGFTFTGWHTAASGGLLVSSISSSATGDQTIYANWLANKYSITYWNGSEKLEGLTPTNYYSNGTYSLPSRIPDLPATYTFEGWYDNAELLGSPITGLAKGSYGDKDMYAKITPIPYPITYKDGATTLIDIEPSSYTVESGTVVLPTLPLSSAPTGKEFGGWYRDIGCTDGPVLVIEANSSGPRTFYVKWVESAAQKISISFVGADGSPANEECTILDASMTTLNEGWYVVQGDVDYANTNITINGNVNLVLRDDARLTVTNSPIRAAIEVTPGNSLSIYAQTRGTGSLTATAAFSSSAGIGGGFRASSFSCGTVSIYGGIVTATGGETGAGIGGGINGDGGEITIKGGRVTAVSGSGGMGIGAGIGGGSSASSQGSLTVAAGIGVCSKATDGAYADVPVNSETYAVSLDGKRYYIVAQRCEIEYMDGETKILGLAPDSYVPGVGTTLAATATSSTPGYEFAGWYANSWLGGSPVTAVSDSATGKQTFYAKWDTITYSITYVDRGSTLDYLSDTYNVESADKVLPTELVAPSGKEFAGWYTDDEFKDGPVTRIVHGSTGNKTFYAKWQNITSDRVPVSFVDENGDPMNETCEVFTNTMRYLDAPWYVVTNNVTLTETLTIEGNVNLVLEDGAKLTVTTLGSSNDSAVHIPYGSSLTIYGQTDGTGELNTYGNTGHGCGIGGTYQGTGGTLTINGGTVIALGGGSGGAGIGSGFGGSFGAVTINAGTVTATGGYDAGAGIGGSVDGAGISVTINGGTVTAKGGFVQGDVLNGAAGIGGGYGSSDHGSLTVGVGLKVDAGASASNLSEVTPSSSGVVELDGKRYYVVSPAPAEEGWPADTSTVADKTAGEAFGVTGDLAGVNAKSLADWAKGNGGVNYGDSIIPDAFLLDCANTAEAVAAATPAAEEAIKIIAITFDSEGNPVLTINNDRTSYGNGKVKLQGTVNIGASAEWHDKQEGDKFFRTVLVP